MTPIRLIQNVRSGQYLGANGEWVACVNEAKEFESIEEGKDFCARCGVKFDAEMLLLFPAAVIRLSLLPPRKSAGLCVSAVHALDLAESIACTIFGVSQSKYPSAAPPGLH